MVGTLTTPVRPTEKFFLVYDPQTRSLLDNGDSRRLSYQEAQALGAKHHAEQGRPMIILEAVNESELVENPIRWRAICGGESR